MVLPLVLNKALGKPHNAIRRDRDIRLGRAHSLTTEGALSPYDERGLVVFKSEFASLGHAPTREVNGLRVESRVVEDSSLTKRADRQRTRSDRTIARLGRVQCDLDHM